MKMDMDFQIISREMIKPSSPDIHHQKPFKLSLLDQLTPPTYFPIILFYQMSGEHYDIAEISAKLKSSLAETLSVFYFFSGREKDNFYIDNYEEGVPFTETKLVGICLSDFLQHPQVNMLNQFLPWRPFSHLPKPETSSLLAIQLNTLECGGIALGVCFSHKIFDANTASVFLKRWTDNHISGSSAQYINTNFSESQLRFPPTESSSANNVLSKMKDAWSYEKQVTVKRYVFNAQAIATLRQKARSERVDNPSRIQTISSFIWKTLSSAATKVSDSPGLSVSLQAVDIRQRITPHLPKDSIGNIFLFQPAACPMADIGQTRLQDIVALTRKAIANVNTELVKSQGEGGPQAFCEAIDRSLQGLLSHKPEMCVFTSWLHFGFNDLDFGWGKPVWSGVLGEAGPAFTNLTIFKETGRNGKDIEAWMIIDEAKMAIVERDPEFLEFATPNPSVLPYC